jgi:hypothetical protein
MFNRLAPVCAATLLLASPALAVDVPASAKKLDAAGIGKLYHGARAAFDNKQNKETLTGEIFYDMKAKSMFGYYVWDKKDRGMFRGKAWIKGDQFCNKPEKGKETCTDVYLDGKTYYEVTSDGKVASVDTLLDNPPALPADAKKLTPDEIYAELNGKPAFVTVFDAGVPFMANINWNSKKKTVSGRFISDGKPEKKFSLKFKVKGDALCFPGQGKDDCYTYFKSASGIYELTADGKMHAVTVTP